MFENNFCCVMRYTLRKINVFFYFLFLAQTTDSGKVLLHLLIKLPDRYFCRFIFLLTASFGAKVQPDLSLCGACHGMLEGSSICGSGRHYTPGSNNLKTQQTKIIHLFPKCTTSAYNYARYAMISSLHNPILGLLQEKNSIEIEIYNK